MRARDARSIRNAYRRWRMRLFSAYNLAAPAKQLFPLLSPFSLPPPAARARRNRERAEDLITRATCRLGRVISFKTGAR